MFKKIESYNEVARMLRNREVEIGVCFDGFSSKHLRSYDEFVKYIKSELYDEFVKILRNDDCFEFDEVRTFYYKDTTGWVLRTEVELTIYER